MRRSKVLTTIFFALFLCSASFASTTEDTTDVKNSIIKSLSQNYQDYLGYQSYAVEMYRNYSTNRSTANSPELHFLGGTHYNHDIVINGLSFRNPLTGAADVSFSTAFFDNINIYKGNIPVQFTNANSAVVELSSPKLTNGFHSSFETLSDNLVGNKFDQNYYRGIFSGSFFDNDKLRFWTAFERKWLGDRLPSSLTSEVLTGSPDMLPNNQLSGWTYHGKLQYELSNKSLMTFTADGSTDEWQEYLHYFNNPSQPGEIAHTPWNKDETYGLNALLEHKFSEKTNINLSVGYFKSEQLRGDGILRDNYEAYNRGRDINDNFIPNPRQDLYNLFKEGDSIYVTVIDSITDPFNYDTSEVFTEFREAYYDSLFHQISSYKQLQGEINHTFSDIHTIKAGFLYKKYSLRYFRDSGPTEGYDPVNINRYGFDSVGVESDNEDWKNDTKHPTELSLYVSDNISLEKVTLYVGVRYDRYNYNALQFKSLERPFDPEGIDPSDITLDESDMVEAKTQSNFNPQIGFSAEASDKFKIFMNWSQNHQIAPYKNMYVGFDNFEALIGSGRTLVAANANLEPSKSQTLNLGFNSTLSKNITLDLNYFNIEVSEQASAVYQFPAYPFSYSIYSSDDHTLYQGVNLLLQYDDGKNFGWFIDATKSEATGPNILFNNIAWKNSQGTETPEYPLDYDRTLKVIAGASYKTNFGIKINLIAKQESGSPYTPTKVFDAVNFIQFRTEPTGEINSSKTDKIRVVDLKLEKDFKFSNHTISAFILVKNLLDKELITGVYTGTGSPTNTGYLETDRGQQNILYNGDEYKDKYEFAQNNPLNFYPPRQIFIGLKTSF